MLILKIFSEIFLIFVKMIKTQTNVTMFTKPCCFQDNMRYFGSNCKQSRNLTKTFFSRILRGLGRAAWTIGPKPVGRNDVFTIRREYSRKAENTIKVIALLFTVYYKTKFYFYFGLSINYFIYCNNKTSESSKH